MIKQLLGTVALIAFLPTQLEAQSAQSRAADQATDADAAQDPAVSDGEDIVVTGRAGSGARNKLETSYSITTLDDAAIRSRAPSSVAETLKSVPGFWVEASGGEGSGNVRARGIPIDGFGSINLLEDGLPVQHDPALGYLNADQAFRIDETVQRIEVVRGGPSSIFYSNAPGGVVNYITRKPGDALSGNARVLYGPTAELFRFDGWIGTPLADGWSLGLGGFYRNEQGVRDPGYTANRGGQFRADLAKDFGDAAITLSYKHLDDNAIFYTGIPLGKNSDGDVVGIPGFDPPYGTTASRASANLKLRSATGTVDFDNTDGTSIVLDQFSALASWDFGDGFRLTNNARYRTSDTVRNGVYPASIATAANYLAGRRAAVLGAYPGASSLVLRYADTGETFDVGGQNGNDLVFENSARPVTVKEDEFLDDLRLSRRFELFGQSHDLSVGGYFARINETFRRYSATTLQDVSDDSRLLDLLAVDATGRVVGSATSNGVSRYGSEFANGRGRQTTWAVYASDEWQVLPTFRIDGGIRYERVQTEGSQEGTRSVDLGDPTTLADNAVLAGSGAFTPFDRDFDRVGATIGVDWQIAAAAGAFARYTSAFRLPSVGSFITSATAVPRTQGIRMYEVGLKYSAPVFSAYATAFLTDFDAYSIGNFQFDTATGGFVQQTIYTDTRAYGLELEATVRPVRWFDFTLNATVQDPTFRNLRYGELSGTNLIPRDYSGNQLLRVPKLALRATPAVTILNDRLRVQADVEHYTKRFADAANTSRLPGYTVLNASARFDLTDRVSLWVYGDNLTNTIGLTEGNPRAGELTSGQPTDELFIGRPILGRNVRLAVDVRF